ncbi:hypothetical protein SDJN02_25750, partial [Cucurbita argyrosperma subsp. argyrosperma]
MKNYGSPFAATCPPPFWTKLHGSLAHVTPQKCQAVDPLSLHLYDDNKGFFSMADRLDSKEDQFM